MRYKLLIKTGHHFSCTCGKCPDGIFIEEISKEDFKELMDWDEDKFIRHTLIIVDAIENKGVTKDGI